LSESFVNTPIAPVSRRRCSKSARLSVGVDAAGGDGLLGAGAAAARDGPGAAPVCLTGRESPDVFGLAGLEAGATLADDGAGFEPSSALLLLGAPVSLDDAGDSVGAGGTGGAGDSGDSGGAGGTGGAGASGDAGASGADDARGAELDCDTSGVPRVALGFIGAQAATVRKTANPAITNRCIDGSMNICTILHQDTACTWWIGA
jgi:hypothetical protein